MLPCLKDGVVQLILKSLRIDSTKLVALLDMPSELLHALQKKEDVLLLYAMLRYLQPQVVVQCGVSAPSFNAAMYEMMKHNEGSVLLFGNSPITKAVDIIILDGEVSKYEEYFTALLPHVKIGTIIFAMRANTKSIEIFPLQMKFENLDWEHYVLPVGAGISVGVFKWNAPVTCKEQE